MRNANRSLLQQMFPGLLLGIIVLVGLIFLGNYQRVSHYINTYHWMGFGLAIGLHFLSLTLRFLKRAINLHHSGIRNVSFVDSMSLFLACLPLAVTPSRFEGSFKGVWLFKKAGVPVERAVSVFMVDQISDGLSVFILLAFGTISFPTLWPLFLCVLLAFLGVLAYFRFPPPEKGKNGVSAKMPIVKRIMPQLRECIEANPSLFTVESMLITFILGIISWAADGAALFTILMGLGFAPSLPLFATAELVYAFATTVSIASRIPGGLGVLEVGMALLLTLLLNFQPDKAVVATILFRLATFWVTFLLGLLIWSIAGKSLGISKQEGRIIEG